MPIVVLRWLIVGGLAMATLGLGPADAVADPLWLDRPDRQAHFWLSYGCALTLTEVLEGPEPDWGPAWGTWRALAVSTAAIGALGLLKEYAIDDGTEVGDLAADALGLATNALVQMTVRF